MLILRAQLPHFCSHALVRVREHENPPDIRGIPICLPSLYETNTWKELCTASRTAENIKSGIEADIFLSAETSALNPFALI